MIVGTVDSEGVPAAFLPVAGQTWTAVVDTGFNGDLELPEGLRAFVNPRFKSEVVSVLASGQSVVEAVYLVDFPFDGQMIEADATFAPGDVILLGTHLMRGYRLEVNFVTSIVVLERPA
jgi:predicted aspartyl protease